jgi:hypothetical protein
LWCSFDQSRKRSQTWQVLISFGSGTLTGSATMTLWNAVMISVGTFQPFLPFLGAGAPSGCLPRGRCHPPTSTYSLYFLARVARFGARDRPASDRPADPAVKKNEKNPEKILDKPAATDSHWPVSAQVRLTVRSRVGATSSVVSAGCLATFPPAEQASSTRHRATNRER